jgi:hypothetical protein
MKSPGLTVVALAALVIASAGVSTETLVEQRESVLPTGQFVAGASVDMTVLSSLSPGSGLRTVTEPVRVTVPPTGTSPVHTAWPDAVKDRVPDEVAASPLYSASSSAPTKSPVMEMPT